MKSVSSKFLLGIFSFFLLDKKYFFSSLNLRGSDVVYLPNGIVVKGDDDKKYYIDIDPDDDECDFCDNGKFCGKSKCKKKKEFEEKEYEYCHKKHKKKKDDDEEEHEVEYCHKKHKKKKKEEECKHKFCKKWKKCKKKSKCKHDCDCDW
jgi:hypothetical protein